MESKLIVRVKDPTLGKGWYKVNVACHPQTEDDHVITLARAADPEATAIQITREYDVPKAGAQ